MPPRAFWKLGLVRLHGDLANYVSQNKAFASEIVLSQVTSADYFASARCPNKANWRFYYPRRTKVAKKSQNLPKDFSGSEKGWTVCLLLVLQDFELEQNLFLIPWLFLSDTFYHRLCSHTISAPDFQKYLASGKFSSNYLCLNTPHLRSYSIWIPPFGFNVSYFQKTFVSWYNSDLKLS